MATAAAGDRADAASRGQIARGGATGRDRQFRAVVAEVRFAFVYSSGGQSEEQGDPVIPCLYVCVSVYLYRSFCLCACMCACEFLLDLSDRFFFFEDHIYFRQWR